MLVVFGRLLVPGVLVLVRTLSAALLCCLLCLFCFLGLLRLLLRFLLFCFLLFRFFGEVALANLVAVGETEHDHHVIGFLVCQNVACSVRPAEIGSAFVIEQPRGQLCFAGDADLRRFREGLLKSIGKPVGHAVAHHHD